MRFSFQGLQVTDEHVAAIELEQPFGLQTAEAAGYEFALVSAMVAIVAEELAAVTAGICTL